MKSIRVCIVGATGFAGIELCRLVLAHPCLELVMATDRKAAGTLLSEVYPSFAGACDLELSQPESDLIAQRADVAFLAVPHTASLALAPELLARGVTVLDLSADYRLHDPAVYEAWYETPHTSPELLSQTVYGLPELNRAGLRALAARRAIGETVLVAVPGCYPTATALAATPALEAGLATGDLVISDAISGVSGAGRAPSDRTHFCRANESVQAYGVASHRHTPEMEQTLSEVAGRPISVVFTPHLAPLTRGLLATVYLEAAAGVALADVRRAYEDRYANEPLVTTLPAGEMPATASVFGTARAQVGVALDDRRRKTIVASCAIDNLGKGAASQAVQCANVILGLPETQGLVAPAPLV
ncbi:N-acetyl-gamma-glutamyl-phosphate reductase [Thermophilibacter immobilis]|uniref:N-acetyl-gamma-glutamyl-phosphate reductase n=1 Tax=Thermophilibacter immobilis TaxID=2779519 RepID=A0A7S7M7B1_9ACTN|nr:N-acetyl-gamma-glutamyl-phosphate reductase [Thermophilibacter immobilis]QOY60111.1 N-acetyl-gamma-glutamyl-phosphate reductase [Thermophilibacter immobilis]